MTVINGIESEELVHRANDIKSAIRFNDKIEDKLHVIMVISNPCSYNKRWRLARQFIEHMLDSEDVLLYVVELAYGNQDYQITSKYDPRHLQLRTETPLWHKENMINLGVKKLLPSNWKAFAWIDADLEFEHMSWATDTLKILNGCKDVVQIFSHCLDMANDNSTLQVFHGFGYQYATGKKYYGNGVNFWHCGFAWAMTRKAYEKIGGLFQLAILGAGDHQMALAMIGISNSIHIGSTDAYKNRLHAMVQQAKHLRVGYVPGVCRHFFHGSKKNRKYMSRWEILIKYKYNPDRHITVDENGVIIPTNECPKAMLEDIMTYFQQRREDDDV